MAYPGEKENAEYLAYQERHANGEEGEGPMMSKADWRKRNKDAEQPKDAASVLYPPP